MGYIFGQGSFFLAQTLVVKNGGLADIAAVCIPLQVISVVQWIADSGGIYRLSQLVQKPAGDGALAGMLQARFSIGLLIGVGGLGLYPFLSQLYPGHIEPATYLLGLIGAVVWSLNATGLCDGLAKTRISALSISAPWVAASLVLMLLYPAVSLGRLQVYVTAAFVVTSACAVTVQWISVRSANIAAIWRVLEIDRAAYSESIRYSLLYIATYLPGVLYGRLVLLIAGHSLAPGELGTLVYVKSAVSAVQQVVGFSRRTVISTAMELLASEARFNLSRIVACQKVPIALCAAASCAAVAYFGAFSFLVSNGAILNMAALFTLAAVLWAIVSSFGFYLVISEAVAANSAILWTTSVFALCVQWNVPFRNSYLAVLVSELSMYVIQLLLYFVVIKFIGARSSR
ncbi:hypothetical protein AAG565_15685 [Fontimonas sp. SYSU GA230001]|uniref:hypothetical protein n=1 Tax=Fontimonas sp. SYSU GA230001 TaxID=3142450 RepID=UPI0032B41862